MSTRNNFFFPLGVGFNGTLSETENITYLSRTICTTITQTDSICYNAGQLISYCPSLVSIVAKTIPIIGDTRIPLNHIKVMLHVMLYMYD